MTRQESRLHSISISLRERIANSVQTSRSSTGHTARRTTRRGNASKCIWSARAVNASGWGRMNSRSPTVKRSSPNTRTSSRSVAHENSRAPQAGVHGNPGRTNEAGSASLASNGDLECGGTTPLLTASLGSPPPLSSRTAGNSPVPAVQLTSLHLNPEVIEARCVLAVATLKAVRGPVLVISHVRGQHLHAVDVSGDRGAAEHDFELVNRARCPRHLR